MCTTYCSMYVPFTTFFLFSKDTVFNTSRISSVNLSLILLFYYDIHDQIHSPTLMQHNRYHLVIQHFRQGYFFGQTLICIGTMDMVRSHDY